MLAKISGINISISTIEKVYQKTKMHKKAVERNQKKRQKIFSNGASPRKKKSFIKDSRKGVAIRGNLIVSITSP